MVNIIESFRHYKSYYTVLKRASDAERIASIYDVITPDMFSQAVCSLREWSCYEPTDLLELEGLAVSLAVAQIYYKDESTRFDQGSFKATGGSYAVQHLLAAELSKRLGRGVAMKDIEQGLYQKETTDVTIICATDGNHGLSVAWGCKRFGARCVIVLHEGVSGAREQAIRKYGADIVRVQGDYDESVRHAQMQAVQNGWFVVSDTSYEGYTDIPRRVCAGYGIVAEETLMQIAERKGTPPSHIFLQAGVGGFASAVTAFMAQNWQRYFGEDAPLAKFILVETDRAPCLSASAKLGTASSVKIHAETEMAGLSCGETSIIAWAILAGLAHGVIAIPDEYVALMLKQMAKPLGDDKALIAGECSTAGLSALVAASVFPDINEEIGITADSSILVFGTEGVMDQENYQKLVVGK